MTATNFIILILFLQSVVNSTCQRTTDTSGAANPAVATLSDVQILEDYIDKTLAMKFETLENNLLNRIRDVIFLESAKHLQTAKLNQITINSRLNSLENILQTSFKQEIVSKINRQQEILEIITEIELNNQNQLVNISAILAKNSSRELCEMKPKTSGNSTATVTSNGSNESEAGADTGVSRLLHVTVPSSVRPDPDAWQKNQVPEEDHLDTFMKNATGCEYIGGGSSGLFGFQLVSTRTARDTRWRRTLAVRGDDKAWLRVTWAATHKYDFYIGFKSNTETQVYDYIRKSYLMQRATPGVMSRERYTQFYYIHLEDGVLSFGALGDTPWVRHNAPVSASDVVQMLYAAASPYGGKLLVCA